MSEPTKEQIEHVADEIIDTCCTDDMRDIARWHLTQLAQITSERDGLREALNRIEQYPVHSEPVGAALAMQDIACAALDPLINPTPKDAQ